LRARHSSICFHQPASAFLSGVALRRFQAWVSWPGSPSPVRLSPDGEVSEMMRDFVAQVELGRRFDRMRERDRTP